jgi:UDP-N-acetylglucosamine--N-acetylmuramyl-(pentapeptide) pyrophosphoryl-undecaprenol N-acetylglucosamine transferase
MVKRVCLVSSGTGGHLWPALVLAEALRDRGHETVLLTEGRRVEQEFLSRVGCRAETLDLRGSGVGQVLRMARGTVDARRVLRDSDVDAVVCTGGRTSVAAGLAGRSLGLPLALLEQNAVAGKANRLLAHLADRVYLGLPPVRGVRHGVLTGTPLRREFRSVDRSEARRRLGLRADQPVVFVTGGSQGAGVLNERVPRALAATGYPVQVLHLTGPDNDEDVRRRYAELASGSPIRAIVRSLALDMADLYAAADLVVCRGGGCTVAELIATGRAAVVVPYPHHKDRQQLHNAKVLERAGAAQIIEQDAFEDAQVEALFRDLLARPERTEQMGRAAASLQEEEASDRIAADLEDRVFVRSRSPRSRIEEEAVATRR